MPTIVPDSDKPRMLFFLLINVKMQTIVPDSDKPRMLFFLVINVKMPTIENAIFPAHKC